MVCLPIDQIPPDEELRISLLEGKSVEDEVLAHTTRSTVDNALSALSPRDGEILRRRFGIGGGEPWTLDAIGYEFGLTRERIRQLEASALKALAAGLGPAAREDAL
jgi:RNA polymerase primary sigma factor